MWTLDGATETIRATTQIGKHLADLTSRHTQDGFFGILFFVGMSKQFHWIQACFDSLFCLWWTPIIFLFRLWLWSPDIPRYRSSLFSLGVFEESWCSRSLQHVGIWSAIRKRKLGTRRLKNGPFDTPSRIATHHARNGNVKIIFIG
jgi:hypothetical protein